MLGLKLIHVSKTGPWGKANRDVIENVKWRQMTVQSCMLNDSFVVGKDLYVSARYIKWKKLDITVA